MNLEKINQWLTLAANLGVLIGLFLLVFELNQVTYLAETDAYVNRLNQIQEANLEIATSESLAGIQVKARADGVDSLDPTELRRLYYWESSVLNRMASQYYQYERGYLDEFTAKNVFNTAVQFVPYWEELGIRFENNRFAIAIKAAATSD